MMNSFTPPPKLYALSKTRFSFIHNENGDPPSAINELMEEKKKNNSTPKVITNKFLFPFPTCFMFLEMGFSICEDCVVFGDKSKGLI